MERYRPPHFARFPVGVGFVALGLWVPPVSLAVGVAYILELHFALALALHLTGIVGGYYLARPVVRRMMVRAMIPLEEAAPGSE
ncbi:hypothetical protein [Nocardioides limicola]|uniref:hypothetical protein n=1 Tax=Nocardioides limicola TaxID=2803368 RepID=UPI00193BCCC4|nr:hypothetical protein [Nocardioides sp. DJM-14]